MDILKIIGFIVFWFVLNRWILPRLGVPTCLSGGCGLPVREDKKNVSNDDKKRA